MQTRFFPCPVRLRNSGVRLNFVCFEVTCAEARRAPVMQSIVVLIVLLYFQVEPGAVQRCCLKWPYVAKAPCTRPEPSSGLSCGAAVAGRRVQSSDVVCSSGVLDSATLTGTSSLATLWNRIGVAKRPSKSRLLRTRTVPIASRNMKELERGSQI